MVDAPARAVLADIQGDEPIPGLRLLATEVYPEELLLSVFEPDGTGGGGGSTVRPTTDPLQMILTIAEILQDECAETSAGWGQARPACPYHPHPARPAARGGEAWWVCERRDERLYRIGTGDVLAASRSKNARKRRCHPPRWKRTSRGRELPGSRLHEA
jgi:hypothetical protein